MNGSRYICADCGTVGYPIKITKGSFIIELGLWLCLLLPGLLYSAWRLSTRFNGCQRCKSKSLVPIGSPRGIKLAQEYSTIAI
jgi:hypothetical protein